MKFSAFLTFTLVVMATTAKADFVSNYSQWREMGNAKQQAYVMGLVDGLLVSTGSKAETAYFTGIVGCFQALEMTSGMLADAITLHYQQNSSDWGNPPGMAFAKSVAKGPCLPYINNARKKYGLPEWPKD